MKIYIDSSSHHFNFEQSGVDIEFVEDVETAQIAVFGTNSDFDIETVRAALNVVRRVIIFGFELHPRIVQELETLDDPKISLYLSGTLSHRFTYTTAVTYMPWFAESRKFYTRYHPELLDKLDNSAKPKYFDVLLGNQRQNRNFAYEYINANGLSDKVVMTYIFNPHQDLLNNENFILETDGVEFYDIEYNGSVCPVKYYGHEMSLSQIIPIGVYNQTAYTLVTETWYDNSFSFYTEKIAKPLLAKRLFVVLSSKHYLKGLRDLGFKTFGSIIDESYDEIEDDLVRWNHAMMEFHKLLNMDQEQVLMNIKDILDHNFRVMRDSDWYQFGRINSELKSML